MLHFIDHCIKKKKNLSFWNPSCHAFMVTCLSVPASFLAWDSSDQSPQRQRVRTGGQVEGCNGSLLSWGTLTQFDCNLNNTVICRGILGSVLNGVESEQTLLNTTEVTLQQCSVLIRWQPTNDLTSPVDLWGQRHNAISLGVAGGRNAGMSSTEAMPPRSAQIMGQQQQQKRLKIITKKNHVWKL